MNKIELGVQLGSKVELCCYCPMLPLGKSGPEKELFYSNSYLAPTGKNNGDCLFFLFQYRKKSCSNKKATFSSSNLSG